MARYVEPYPIGIAQLTATNVADEAAYSATYGYAKGDLAAYNYRVYESQTGEAGHVVTNVSSGNAAGFDYVGVADGSTFAVNDRVSLRSTGALPAPLSSNVLYWVVAKPNPDRMIIAATQGGTGIDLTSNGSGVITIYRNPNWGNLPAASPTLWIDTGPVAKLAMFDLSNSTKTRGASSIQVTLTPGARFDTIALIGLENVSSVQVSVSNGTIFFNQTFQLADNAWADNWYNATHAVASYKKRFAVSSIPPLAGAAATLTLSGTGMLGCGTALVGLSKEIGHTEFRLSTGINDYTDDLRDRWGNLTLAEYGFSDRGAFALEVDAYKSDAVLELLTERRAKPGLFLMEKNPGAPGGWTASGILYGRPRSFQRVVENAVFHLMSLEVEGM